MRVVLDPAKLRAGLQVRGMGIQDLAVAAGLTPATVSAALSGKAVNLRSALAMTRALGDRPVIIEMAELMPDESMSP